jgi:hypothetical protein
MAKAVVAATATGMEALKAAAAAVATHGSKSGSHRGYGFSLNL